MGMGGGRSGLVSEINVTPLVDVVLVLLIIFIVTMPVKLKHITLEVPRELEADEDPSQTTAPITVTGKLDGTVVVHDGVSEQIVQRIDLAKTLRPLMDKKKTEKLVFVDFSDRLDYGDAVSIMDTVRGAGAKKVAFRVRENEFKVRR